MRIDSWYDRAEISPDGRRLVFSGSLKGRRQLFVRELASTTVAGLDDTENGLFRIWSPDSGSVAFFATGRLKRVAVAGGSATVLAETPSHVTGAATWTNGTSLFSAEDGSILCVLDRGGTPTRPETVPWHAGTDRFLWPRFLPDGRHFLVSKEGEAGVFVASLDTDIMQRVCPSFRHGAPGLHGPGGAARIAGALLLGCRPRHHRLQTGAPTVSQLHWYDRQGRRKSTLTEPERYAQVVLAPRGRRATRVRTDAEDMQGSADLWDVDLTSGVLYG